MGVHVLDGDHFIFEKVLGVAGVKGFGGGFGNATLQAFGEGQTKTFVQEAVNESLKLEAALSQLDTPKKIVIMHYSPVAETLEGENVEIRPFLGTSRLSMPIDHLRRGRRLPRPRAPRRAARERPGAASPSTTWPCR